jgi:hypothetical protein
MVLIDWGSDLSATIWEVATMGNKTVLAVLSALALYVCPVVGARTPSPENAQVYFIWPRDGTVVRNGKFWVRMGLRNMGLAPKGTDLAGTGHHHLLIDTELPAMGEPIPSDRNHLHFGAGESEARVELEPGTHTLQLLLGDKDHVPHDPPVYSEKITIVVK